MSTLLRNVQLRNSTIVTCPWNMPRKKNILTPQFNILSKIMIFSNFLEKKKLQNIVSSCPIFKGNAELFNFYTFFWKNLYFLKILKVFFISFTTYIVFWPISENFRANNGHINTLTFDFEVKYWLVTYWNFTGILR